MMPAPKRPSKRIAFLPVMARVTNGCEALSFKNVVDSAAPMTMRLGLFSGSQHLDPSLISSH
jgi:hypothetical protein